MKRTLDLIVALSVISGAIIGLLAGLLVGNARTCGAVGAMIGLVVGCSLTIIPPRVERTPMGPSRWRAR